MGLETMNVSCTLVLGAQLALINSAALINKLHKNERNKLKQETTFLTKELKLKKLKKKKVITSNSREDIKRQYLNALLLGV